MDDITMHFGNEMIETSVAWSVESIFEIGIPSSRMDIFSTHLSYPPTFSFLLSAINTPPTRVQVQPFPPHHHHYRSPPVD
jgi:hypothetical protein